LSNEATIQDSSAVPRVNAAVDRIHAQENNRLTNACELKPDKLDISLDLIEIGQLKKRLMNYSVI
jgi:hypothetical protein